MEEIDYIFSKLTEEERFHEIKDIFSELGIDIFCKTKSGEINIKSLNELFQELSDKWEMSCRTLDISQNNIYE